MSYDVVMLTKERAVTSWAHGAARARIAEAMEASPTLLTLADVETAVRGGSMNMWEVYGSNGLDVATVITEVVRGSRGCAINVVGIGGAGMPDWIADLTKALDDYRASLGALYLAEMGRRGWVKVLSQHGWVEGPTVMLKVA